MEAALDHSLSGRGVLIGPEIGLQWITDHHTIEVISEVGLILLLFIIGLEIDLKKLRASGKPVLVTGILQFLLSHSLDGWFSRPSDSALRINRRQEGSLVLPTSQQRQP